MAARTEENAMSRLIPLATLALAAATLAVALSITLRPTPVVFDQSDNHRAISADIRDLSAALDRLAETVGQPGSYAGEGTGLFSEVAGVRVSNFATPDDVEMVLSEVESISARLSDICFNLNAC